MNEYLQQLLAILTIVFILYTFYILTFLPLIKRKYQCSKIIKQLIHNHTLDTDFNIEQNVQDIYQLLIEAIQNNDLELIKQFLTPQLYNKWQIKLNWSYYTRHYPSKDTATISDCYVVGVDTTYPVEIWVYVRGHHGPLFYKKIRKGRKQQVINLEFIEYWKFVVTDQQLYLDEIYTLKQLPLSHIPIH